MRKRRIDTGDTDTKKLDTLDGELQRLADETNPPPSSVVQPETELNPHRVKIVNQTSLSPLPSRGV